MDIISTHTQCKIFFTDKLNNLGFLHPVPIPQGNWLKNTRRLDPILFFKAELTPDYIVRQKIQIHENLQNKHI